MHRMYIIYLQSLSAGIDVMGNLTGDIEVTGDVLSSGSINVGGKLGTCRLCTFGRILIHGLFAGNISIAEQTDKQTLIHLLGGLDDNGSIVVNASEGDFNANGDILVGPLPGFGDVDPITFDGCIQITDNGSGGYGDLNGDIDVVGCLSHDVDICVEGNINGDITLTQTGCSPQYQVAGTCSPCP